ncbi:abortive infection family protein [Ureibacillus sp. MALMAid1270]|uniref:abortive infection family protein n=1 Tax=Ureibacillus sp. MALMAid1270 TaxID=3411629 RepID=UPI003BA54976
MSDFTYELPFSEAKLLTGILGELKRENELTLYGFLQKATLFIDDLGTSYYVDRMGRWNAKGIKIKISVNPAILDKLDSSAESKVEEICERLIPGNTGFDIKGIIFIPDLSREFETLEDLDVLANMNAVSSEAIQVLSDEIKSKLQDNQPELALDRLHTFSIRFFRELCKKYKLDYKKEDSLHTLLSKYRKFAEETGVIQSNMTLQILKANTNILNNFNNVRNEESYAHDNEILNKIESKLICNHVIALLKFIDEIDETLELLIDFNL